MPTAMTYSSLVGDVQVYADRNDDPFVNQIPRLIALAEFRIATEVHALGYRKFVSFTIPQGTYVVAKPADWRETVDLNIGTGTDNASRKFLLNRSYEYCRVFWPNSDLQGSPRYFSDYDFNHFLIVATPDADYPAELSYHQKPLPLDSTNQQNWTTMFAPQLILYATLLEAQPFLMRPERTQEFQSLYDRAAAAIMGEEKRRTTDASTQRKDVS